MTEDQWKFVCVYLRQKLGTADKVVVNSNTMKRDCGLKADYYPAFVEYAKRLGRDFAFDMTAEQTESEPWEFVIVPARRED